MEISTIYDNLVAHRFDQDPFGIYGESREFALRQIRENLPPLPGPILDIGMGTGSLLLKLHEAFPASELFGLEVSRRMREVAERKFLESSVPVRIHAKGAEEIPTLFPAGGLGLVTLHYVLNYLDTPRTLANIHRALKPGGYLSLATSTGETFPVLHGLAKRFVSADFLQGKILVPESLEEISLLAAQAGFEVIRLDYLRKELSFEDIEHLEDFALHSGWMAHPLSHQLYKEHGDLFRDSAAHLFPLKEWFVAGVALFRRP